VRIAQSKSARAKERDSSYVYSDLLREQPVSHRSVPQKKKKEKRKKKEEEEEKCISRCRPAAALIRLEKYDVARQ
jgi:hypothetical protein